MGFLAEHVPTLADTTWVNPIPTSIVCTEWPAAFVSPSTSLLSLRAGNLAPETRGLIQNSRLSPYFQGDKGHPSPTHSELEQGPFCKPNFLLFLFLVSMSILGQ